MDRIHVANLVAENTNLTRTITTITTEMATIKNLMGTIQEKINQLALNRPQGVLHTVPAQTHNCVPGTHPPDTNESYCWTHGRTRNNEHTIVTCCNKKNGHISTSTLQNCDGGSDKWITTITNVRRCGNVTRIENSYKPKLNSILPHNYHNQQKAASMRVTLHEMGHPQPSTPIQVDNLCAAGIANNEIKQKRSKAMDMRLHWMRDRINQDNYIVYWKPE